MDKVKTLILILSMLLAYSIIEACTIGIASGSVTESGKPLIWKTRDRASRPYNQVFYNTEFEINFVSVVDTTETICWMGLNEEGFAILNSAAYDLMETRENNHGYMMIHALGNFTTVEEFEDYLIATNGDRIAWGNFAVMDRYGSVSMFEASNTEYWRLDADDTESGWMVRTNFSVNGGGDDGLDRYNRSLDIISELAEDDELTAKEIFRHNLRDLSDENSQEQEIPFAGHSVDESPFGFYDTRYSITDNSSVSGVVIQGILPEQDPRLSVMYTALGNPLFTPAVPVFPVGQPSDYLFSNSGHAEFNTKSLEFKEFLYSSSNTHLLDTFGLKSESNTFFEDMLEIEENAFEETEELVDELEDSVFTNETLLNFQEELYTESYNQYHSLQIDLSPTPDFSIASSEDFYTGIAVIFSNDTTHNPTEFEWDFNNDGVTDSYLADPSWNFPAEGNYPITLKTFYEGSEFSLTKDIYIESNVSADTPLKPQGILKIKAMQNPFYKSSGSKQSYQISFSLTKETEVIIVVYDAKGRKVKKLLSQSYIPGDYQVNWDLRNQNGKTAPSGIYFFKFETDYGHEFRKAVVYK